MTPILQKRMVLFLTSDHHVESHYLVGPTMVGADQNFFYRIRPLDARKCHYQMLLELLHYIDIFNLESTICDSLGVLSIKKFGSAPTMGGLTRYGLSR